MYTEVSTLCELSAAELDVVGAGSLVNLNLNIGIQLANQTNIALFSTASQGGGQGQNILALIGNFSNVGIIQHA